MNDELHLSFEEEAALIKKIQSYDDDYDDAVQKLLQGNRRFIRAVAKRYVYDRHTLNELIKEGNKGLMQAAKKFDDTKGYRFISYAIFWVRRSIQQAIDRKAMTVDGLKGLSERKVDIIRMYFGFGCEKRSLEEIQAKYDFGTPKRVIFIIDNALRKLFMLNKKPKM